MRKSVSPTPPDREAAQVLILTLANLEESNPSFADYLSECITSIKYQMTRTVEQDRESILYAIENLHCRTVAEIAEECDMTRAEAKSHLDQLVADGHLVITKRGGYKGEGGNNPNAVLYQPKTPKFLPC